MTGLAFEKEKGLTLAELAIMDKRQRGERTALFVLRRDQFHLARAQTGKKTAGRTWFA
jgi:hypothetical protein